MNIDANDPRWTAYALGEVTDPSERAEMDRALEESPDAQRLVDEIRDTSLLLANELHAEPALGLTNAQRRRIDARSRREKGWSWLRLSWAMPAFAVIGIVLVSLVAVRIYRQIDNSETRSALLKQPESARISERGASSSSNSEKRTEPTRPTALSIPQKALSMEAAQPEIRPMESPISSTGSPVPQQAPERALLEGLVTDRSGGPLPGAEVEIRNEATGVTRRALTDTAGRYALPELSSGSYKLHAEMSGFEKKEITGINLAESSPTKLNVQLAIAPVQNTVQVSVETENLLLESKSAGLSAANMNMQRDGITVNDVRSRTSFASPVQLSPKSIEQFKMVLAPVDAEMDRGNVAGQHKKGKFNTEAYDHIVDNPFLDAGQNPLSTFSIDVDTASYSNVRRFLDQGRRPPKDAVRIEELINYFDYDYKGPTDDSSFAVNFELTEAPWKPEHRLLRVGIKAREIKTGMRPRSNLVFLIDVSGSMSPENKLPLVKQSLRLLVDQLTESDRIAIVVYAGDSGIVLPSTSGDQKERIRQAIDRLHAGGSTNGASGIELAYKTAQENLSQGGVNRVILATDGDFNVGTTSRGDLTRLIEEKSNSGVFLSALGFGMGNYKDSTLETLADKGRGNYAYIDTLNEAKKLLVEQINGTLVPIAKDVKIQVEFNPQRVSAYRIIGYENRIMAKEDFNDDQKQAGVIGAGHAVTALYEIVPAGVPAPKGSVDPLKYQKPVQPSKSAGSNELVTVKIRSKKPDEDKSVLSQFVVKDSVGKFAQASRDFKFTAAVATFGMVLRGSPYKGNADLEHALAWAKEGKGADPSGYRQEFIRLIHRAISF